MKNFYTPPHAITIAENIPLVFLAGPVQGAPDWQTRFASQILSSETGAVASPRRTSEDQVRFDANEQVAWEHAALERARSFGVLAFWLAAQNLDDKTYPAGRAYAQTTRLEIGKALGWKQFQPDLPIIIGFDPEYTTNGGGSEGYIRREAAMANIAIYHSDDKFVDAIMSIMDSQKLINATEAFVKDRLAGENTGHDWWHAERVRNTARHIQATEGGDALVIDLALLLHDVGDRKVIGNDEGEDDYTIAEDFLRSQTIDDKTIEHVMSIIKHMSYSKSFDTQQDRPDSIEFQIVQDADRLDALGAIGIARAFAFGGSRERPLYDPHYEPQAFTSSSAYKKSRGSTLHHFEEKLFLLKDLLNTTTARQIAGERDTYMHEFQQRFLDEWHGKK